MFQMSLRDSLLDTVHVIELLVHAYAYSSGAITLGSRVILVTFCPTFG